MAAPIRLVIADDDPDARRLLSERLARETDVIVVGAAADGGEAVTLAETLHPDLVLFDTEMSGLDGIAATERLTGALPSAGRSTTRWSATDGPWCML